jgi:putative serine protease PepD
VFVVRGHTINSVDNNNHDPSADYQPRSDPIDAETTDATPRAGSLPFDSLTPDGLMLPRAMPADPEPSTPPLFPYTQRNHVPDVAEPKSGPKDSLRIWAVAIVAGMVGALSLVAALWVAGTFDKEPTGVVSSDGGDIVEIREVVTPDDETIASAVARKVVPSIVTVDVGTDNAGTFDLFGSGSGVVLEANGLIVTNHHVIEDADRVRVIFGDGRTYEAEIVGTDRRTDLAVLRIDANDLTPIEIGSTDDAEIGQIAIAVGSPLGLEGGPSLTVGVISAFGRRVTTGLAATDTLFDMLQTDAPITQGSSGGALVDENGRLLGITSAIGVSSAGAEGIGFAIPIELVTRITDEIIKTGSVQHAFLGVTLGNAFEETSDGAQVPAGAIVSEFPIDASAAELAGVEAGDRIVAYNGTEIATPEDLISGLRRLRVGDLVTLEVVRGSDVLEIDVVLRARPEGT